MAGKVLVVQGGTLIDGTGRPPVENALVIIEGGRFKAVGKHGQVAVPEEAEVIDARGQTILPGFICRNMPLGAENTLSNQECRDIAFYIGNLPRPAGDRQGPVIAVTQQFLMTVMPPLLQMTASNRSGDSSGERSPEPAR